MSNLEPPLPPKGSSPDPGGQKALVSCGENAGEGPEAPAPMLVNACLVLISLAGSALLVWWALEFHRSNRQLWMVPVGLVAAGTPAVVFFAVFASDAWPRIELRRLARSEPPAPDPEK